jgi:hypothetical protein
MKQPGEIRPGRLGVRYEWLRIYENLEYRSAAPMIKGVARVGYFGQMERLNAMRGHKPKGVTNQCVMTTVSMAMVGWDQAVDGGHDVKLPQDSMNQAHTCSKYLVLSWQFKSHAANVYVKTPRRVSWSCLAIR